MKRTTLMGLFGTLILGIPTLANAQTEWIVKDGFFNGVGFRSVYTAINEQTALLFTFNQENESCIYSVGARFPVEPALGDRHKPSFICSYHIDDGSTISTHGYQCFSHVYSGQNYVSMITKPTTPSNALKSLVEASRSAERIGFMASGGTEPVWFNVESPASALDEGAAFCH